MNGRNPIFDSHLLYFRRSTFRHRFQRNTTAAVGDQGGSGTTTGTQTGTGDAGGGSASQTGTGTGTGSTSSTGSSTGTGTGTTTGSASDDLRDGDWRTLRTKYETAKGRAAILDSLGIPDTEVTGTVQQFRTLRTEAVTLAKELGYEDSEAELHAAFAKDPIALMSLLRKEKAEQARTGTQGNRPGEGQDVAELIRQQVEAQTKPFTEQVNKQMSDAVTSRIGTEFDKAYKTALPDTPQAVRDLVEDYVIEYIQSKPELIQAAKFNSDYSAVEDTVKVVAGRMKQVFADWYKHETSRGRGTGTGTGEGQGQGQTRNSGRPTIDQIIENPGLINSRYNE